MSIFKKKTDETLAAERMPYADDGSTGTMADVEAVMKKYDRESNVRIWEGTPRYVVMGLLAVFSLFCIAMTLWSKALQEVALTSFLGLIVIIGFVTYPASKNHVRPNHIPWYDMILMVLGAGSFFYYALNAMKIINMSVRIGTVEVIVGVIGVLIVLELCRRCVGVPILCVVGVLMIYAFINIMSSGGGRTFVQALSRTVYNLFYTTTGVIGTPINVCYKFIVLFIIFGAFLERTGIGDYFVQLANAVVGRFSGGPAKVAVVASALEGMCSGSSVANTVGSGSVTIPMMKKTGYKPEFAAAVEAAASTGGQIMPPIMGAAAFLMAEYIGIPYAEVAVKAILPAILYFTGIFIAVHLEAKKLGLKGIPKEELPHIGGLLKQAYLLIPLILLVWLGSSNTRTIQTAAALSIVAAIVVGALNPQNRITPMKVLEALESGARGAITVACACAVAGMIAGCITVTGLASTMINGIVALAGNATILGLVLTMLCCIVLGMGVPTTANYCIMASTCAPILVQLGFPDVAAHFFVFYFGIVADITPPVALAAYAGAAIAKSNPMKTGVTATKLAIAAFIVPYIFTYNPVMLFENVDGWWHVAQISVTAVMGLFGIAAALNGYLYRHIHWTLRLVLVAGGLCMMVPGTLTDVVGLALVLAVVFYQRVSARKDSGPAVTA
ncbi:MAG: C4-dicarboxylate ABC transporter [Firmicutes bacterium CAG:176_63_11]|nr:MAG: C4-dicarboxylate ABC transporter [Firmicutes bacterium CAG:176_63_11]